MTDHAVTAYHFGGSFDPIQHASGGSTIELGGGGRPPHRYKMPPLLLNCRPPSHYDIHMNTTLVTVFPHRGDVIHSQLSGIRLK